MEVTKKCQLTVLEFFFINTDSDGRETAHTYKTHTDVSHGRAGRKPPPRVGCCSKVLAGRVRGMGREVMGGRVTHQAVHDAHTIWVHGERLLVQLLGLF